VFVQRAGERCYEASGVAAVHWAHAGQAGVFTAVLGRASGGLDLKDLRHRRYVLVGDLRFEGSVGGVVRQSGRARLLRSGSLVRDGRGLGFGGDGAVVGGGPARRHEDACPLAAGAWHRGRVDFSSPTLAATRGRLLLVTSARPSDGACDGPGRRRLRLLDVAGARIASCRGGVSLGGVSLGGVSLFTDAPWPWP
jgi:hypothetical protein